MSGISRMLFSSLLLGVIFFKHHVSSAPLDDLVQHVPGYGRPPTTQFSGFLNATDGCNTEVNGQCYLHYWLAMADTTGSSLSSSSSSSSKPPPVILWLNGGPGSSSILGFLTELGPLLMNATGGLMSNPYAWTKAPAHVFALEAPVGVGYSYCERQQKEGKPCENTDRYTASASRAALVDFFTNKFPEFQSSDFYITGESYAGVYIPTLANEILTNGENKVPLKGIAVGDPCTDNDAQADSMDDLWYGHKYGLVDDDVYDLLWSHCDIRTPNLLSSKHGSLDMLRMKWNRQLMELDDLTERRQKALSLFNDLVSYNEASQNGKRNNGVAQTGQDDEDKCKLAYRKFLLSSSRGLSQSWRDLFIDDYSLFSPIDNGEDDAMGIYMMRDDVKAALHVEQSPTETWPYASQGFHYDKEYDACNWGKNVKIQKSMIDFYKEIVPQLDRTWVYNGDTDPCVSYEGTRTAVKRVGLDELDGGSYRPWFYNHTATTIEVLQEKPPLFGPNLLLQNLGAQFGGHVVNYKEGLSFVTIHGSGHMVPQFRPQAALHFLQMFLAEDQVGGALLAPLLPTNATLMAMSNDDFTNALDDWTELAKTTDYVDVTEVVEEDNGDGDTVMPPALKGNDKLDSSSTYLRG